MEPVRPDETDDRTAGLAAELAAAAPRQWWNRGTLVLAVLAVLMAGFLGGVQVQKHYGTTPASSGPTVPRGNFGGFPAGGQNVPSPSPTTAETTGTVKLVDDGTIYLQTKDGATVTVRTSKDTVVQMATKGSLKDIQAGDQVSIRGDADGQGTLAATSVAVDKK